MNGAGLLRRFVAGTGLESDTFPGMPVVEVVGTERVLIENHSGILSYDNCTVCVSTDYGYVCVEGNGLYLTQMKRDRIVINGRICRVSLERGGK